MKNKKKLHGFSYSKSMANFEAFCWNFSSNMTECFKIGKKSAISKVQKKHYLHFQKWQKINFCTRKKYKKLPKMQFSDFFGGKN